MMIRSIARAVGAVLLLLLVVAAMPTGAAAQESTTQMQLVGSPGFLQRVAYLMVQHARTVKAEALLTACHGSRTNYATAVINNPAGMAQQAAVMLAGGVNLLGTASGSAPNATSSATDAAILSQIATFWSHLAGCDTGT